MFTIKALFDGGRTAHECYSYRIRLPGVNVGETIADKNMSSLDLLDADGKMVHSFVVDGPVYIMNANGKTIDTLDGPPRDAPR